MAAGTRPRIDVVRVLVWSVVGAGAVLSVGIPHFGRCGCRLRANESAAIATLKNLASAQRQAIAGALRDSDGDGRGEALLMSELATARPPLLSAAFAATVRCRVRRSAHWFEVHLPAAGGGWTSDRGSDVDAEAAERQWCAFAWPASTPSVPAGTIRPAFAIDADGVLWRCANVDFRYRDELAPGPDDRRREPARWTRVE